MMMRGRETPAYLTIYLAMTLGVMVTLFWALFAAARVSTIQMETACIADICMDNVLAEYHRELFRRYNILALDSSYGTKTIGRTNLEGRLAWYLDENFSIQGDVLPGSVSKRLYKDFLGLKLRQVEITEFSLLSDWDGEVFRKQAVEALQDDFGIIAIQDTLDWMKTVEEYQLDVRDVEAEKRAVDEKIDSYQGREIEESGQQLHFENPTARIELAKKTGILSLVLGNQNLSGKKIDQSNLILQRMKERKSNHGTIRLKEQNVLQRKGEQMLFNEYLLSYFGNYLDVRKDGVLEYEVEYVLMGKNADAANLRSTLNRLLAIREASNVTYLYSDQEKCKAAEGVALVLSLLAGEPELKDSFQATIILGWAFVESIYDLKVLMKGGNVPLMKDDKSWHYGLEGVLEGIWESDADLADRAGLSYADYLRILLTLTDASEITRRAMNVVEANVRLTPGNQNFRMDACYVQVETRISVESAYGRQTEILENKRY